MSLFDDASIVTTPNAYKASKLYSIKPTSGLGDMTVVRATTATRVNSSNLIESVAINVPRLDYPPLGGCPSILVEPLRTNLVLRSEEFSNAYWTKTNATVTANTTTAPDGTSTADILVENSTSNVVFGVRATPRPSGLTLTTTYSVSFFAKKITRNFCYYDDFNGFQNPIVQVFFNLQTGLVGNTSAGVLNPKMENYGNGWYRCSFQFVASGATPTQIDYRIASATTDNGFTYTGVIGQQAIAIWGAQFEAGSNATSYIPTTTIQLTRNADVISKTGISALIGQTAGTMFVDVDLSKININEDLVFINAETNSSNRITFFIESNNNLVCNFVVANVIVQINANPSWQVGINKVAVAYANNDAVLFFNGNLVSTSTTVLIPRSTQIHLGCYTNGALQLNDRINTAALFTTRLTNAELASLTTL